MRSVLHTIIAALLACLVISFFFPDLLGPLGFLRVWIAPLAGLGLVASAFIYIGFLKGENTRGA